MTDKKKKPALKLKTNNTKPKTSHGLSDLDITNLYRVHAGYQLADSSETAKYQHLLNQPLSAEEVLHVLDVITQPLLRAQAELVNSNNVFNVLFKDVVKVTDEQWEEADKKVDEYNKKAQEEIRQAAKEELEKQKVLTDPDALLAYANKVLAHKDKHDQKTIDAALDIKKQLAKKAEAKKPDKKEPAKKETNQKHDK